MKKKGPKMAKLKPKVMAPLFTLTAIFHLAAIATRFEELYTLIPASISSAILFVHFPLLAVEGLFEGKLDYGVGVGPTWLRIRSWPVRASFTFAFTYLAIFVLQTWDIEIGPVDPSPPESWPLITRAWWFMVMTLGMAFPNYLAATGILVPALRLLTAPFRILPVILTAPVLAVLGAAAGWAALMLMSNQHIHQASRLLRAIEEDPALSIAVIFGSLAAPAIFGGVSALIGSILGRNKKSKD